MDFRVQFLRSSSPNAQIVSGHRQKSGHPHRPDSSTSRENLVTLNESEEGDQKGERSTNLTPDGNNRSRSFNFVRKFRERRCSGTNSDSALHNSKKRRSVSPIETGIEVIDDHSIMNLSLTPEEVMIYETAENLTVTNAELVLNAKHSLNIGDRPSNNVSPNRNSASFSSSTGHDNHSESCSTYSSTSLLSDERQMNDEETSTSDAPTTTISPVSRDPVDREEKQEMEVTTLGEQVLHPVPYREAFSKTVHISYLIKCGQDLLERYKRIPLKKYRFCAFILLSAITFAIPGFITGLMWGLYISTILFLYACVSDPIQQREVDSSEYAELLEKVNEECAKEEDPAQSRIHRGWMNIYEAHYNPHTFHVNSAQTVLVRLDGKMLRISKPDRVMLKHGFHSDPTLIETEPRMISQSIYDLTSATVRLKPRRLARRRWFSRKYPICIKLSADNNETLSGAHLEYATMVHVPETRGREEVDDEDNKSQNEDPARLDRKTIAVEVGREADEYLSDTEDSGDEELFLPRSASDVHLHHSSHTGGILTRFRKAHSTHQSFRSSRTIYLFARCSREKERWFHQLKRACYKFSVPKDIQNQRARRFSLPGHLSHERDSFQDYYFLYILHALQFNKHLAEILKAEEDSTNTGQSGVVFMDLGRTKWNEPNGTSGKELIRVANLLVSRVFYDFCRDKYWIKAVQTKIQNKLATIHLPYFIETLELSSFNIGTAIPMIEKIYEPNVNEWGIWVDFEVRYEGMIKLALETRVNLMRIKEQRDSIDCSPNSVPNSIISFRPLSRYSDEEIPESPETSPDEDYGSKMKYDIGREKKKGGGKKMLHLIDKIAHSNLFKEASELRPIRKIMEEVSSTRLMLNVEVTKLQGTMTVNLAAPPSDRLWYSFRRPPAMSIHAVPQVGDRTCKLIRNFNNSHNYSRMVMTASYIDDACICVNFEFAPCIWWIETNQAMKIIVVLSTLSDWIERKMVQLLEKNLVVPNMDDMVIPVMTGNDLLQGL